MRDIKGDATDALRVRFVEPVSRNGEGTVQDQHVQWVDVSKIVDVPRE